MSNYENLTVGVVGATGEVGKKMLSILEERDFPGDVRLFASENSVGLPMFWRQRKYAIEDLTAADLGGLDLALFSAGAAVSEEFAPQFVAAGATVIDNSSAWRKDPEVPLVVSEVNPEALDEIPKGIVANPNCTTMIAMPVLNPLNELAGLTAFKASTYMAVSGSGRKGVDELGFQLHKLAGSVDDLVSGRPANMPEPEVFAAPIAFNVVPKNGDWEGNDTTEELKLRDESRRILNLPELAVSATCVRVPVVTGHSMILHARFEQPLAAEIAKEALSCAPGVQLSSMPTPLQAVGEDVIYVGRIRADDTEPNGLVMFVTGDNLRKGAALNAVQIAELLLPRLISR